MNNAELSDSAEIGIETSASTASPSSSSSSNSGGSATLGAGWNDPWGANPADNAPTSHGAFNPPYICLLHIRFEGFAPNWRLKINHASYPYQDTQAPEKRLERALGIFTAKILGDYEFGDQTMQDLGHKSYEWINPGHQTGHPRDSTSFSDFKFKSATEIFIFLESPTVYVGPKERLLACTKYGHSRPSEEMAKNYSFYGADIVPDTELGQLRGKGQLIRVQNHAKVAGGASAAADLFYSLNIHFKIPGGPAGLIPIIIDPDTGNGQGNEP